MTNEDEVLTSNSTEMAKSILMAAEKIEAIAEVLAVDIENWGAEYAAALRRRAYALSA